jgi:hypothetical protein
MAAPENKPTTRPRTTTPRQRTVSQSIGYAYPFPSGAQKVQVV